MGNKKDSARILIIGAGLAGTATACSLAGLGEADVLVIDQEPVAGMHSSGRNAAMVRQIVPGREVLPLTLEGARSFRGQAGRLDDPLPFTETGSLLLARAERWRGLQAEARRAGSSGIEFEVRNRRRIIGSVPCTEGGDFEGGIWCPTDGVTDTGRLVESFCRRARVLGARISTGLAARRVEVRDGRVHGVETTGGFIRCGTVVNAAGAWAGELAEAAGALAVKHQPLRRHLYYTGELEWADPRWPFVWDLSHEVYFRPESAGLLLSPCDESPAPPGLPCLDPQAEDLLADKLGRAFPRLLEVPVARCWAGLRTFAPDRLFVIGWDPKVEGFYWISGLGGQGVTTCPAVGELAARELLDPQRRSESPFSPARFC